MFEPARFRLPTARAEPQHDPRCSTRENHSVHRKAQGAPWIDYCRVSRPQDFPLGHPQHHSGPNTPGVEAYATSVSGFDDLTTSEVSIVWLEKASHETCNPSRRFVPFWSMTIHQKTPIASHYSHTTLVLSLVFALKNRLRPLWLHGCYRRLRMVGVTTQRIASWPMCEQLDLRCKYAGAQRFALLHQRRSKGTTQHVVVHRSLSVLEVHRNDLQMSVYGHYPADLAAKHFAQSLHLRASNCQQCALDHNMISARVVAKTAYTLVRFTIERFATAKRVQVSTRTRVGTSRSEEFRYVVWVRYGSQALPLDMSRFTLAAFSVRQTHTCSHVLFGICYLRNIRTGDPYL